jgi:hypothetical protein
MQRKKSGGMWAKGREANGGGKGFKKLEYLNKQRKGKVWIKCEEIGKDK